MNILALTFILFGSLVVLMLLNLPISFALATVGLMFLLLTTGPNALYLVASTSWSAWTDFLLIATPMFVLMAAFLERSGVAEDLYDSIYKWLGVLPGGLAMGTLFICTIFAAMSGTSALGTLSMGVIAMPSMLKRKYDEKMVIGAIASGGTLGILIPPRLGMIMYSYLSGVSVGKLFIAGIMPGVIMSAMFVAWVGRICVKNPFMGPPIPVAERFTMREKVVSLRSVIIPVVLIFMVLGLIYFGVTTATEAAGVGAFGAFLCVLIYRRLSWKLMKQSLTATLRITSMVGFLILGAKIFTQAYTSLGAGKFVTETIAGFGLNPYIIIIGTQLVILFLGCFMDGFGIMIVCIPIFLPLIISLGFDPVWFGILFVINLEAAYLTPPFGLNLFYMRMLAPKTVKIGDIYKSVIPFISIMLVNIILIMVFPELALWLPSLMK